MLERLACCASIFLFLAVLRTISETFGQKHRGGSGGNRNNLWRLSAIIACEVLVCIGGRGGVRPELSRPARVTSFLPLLCDGSYFLAGGTGTNPVMAKRTTP